MLPPLLSSYSKLWTSAIQDEEGSVGGLGGRVGWLQECRLPLQLALWLLGNAVAFPSAIWQPGNVRVLRLVGATPPSPPQPGAACLRPCVAQCVSLF